MALLLMKRRLARAGTGHAPADSEWLGACERAQRAFFRDHLGWWVPSFAAGLARKGGGTGYTGALARVLAAWIPAEARRLGITAVLRPARPTPIEPPEEQSGCAACPLHA
jgi:TorA maturation chaperone TorD